MAADRLNGSVKLFVGVRLSVFNNAINAFFTHTHTHRVPCYLPLNERAIVVPVKVFVVV